MGQDARVHFLSRPPVPPRPGVVYWMQSSARTRYNHALEYAVNLANHRSEPLTVLFALSPGYPGARLRHYWFLVQGLRDIEQNLARRGIPFVVVLGNAPDVAVAAARQCGTVVTDKGYLRHHRAWRETLAHASDCPVVQVESNAVVPVHHVSSKDEFAARTIRPKIHRHLDDFLQPVPEIAYHAQAQFVPARRESAASRSTGSTGSTGSTRYGGAGVPLTFHAPLSVIDLSANATAADTGRILNIAAQPEPLSSFVGGEDAADEVLSTFLRDRFAGYAEARNIPDRDAGSHLSAYLHYGHISPVEIALRAREYVESSDEATGTLTEDLETLLEELIVRRELALNFTEFNPHYDRWDGLPEWARKTLRDHSTDDREYRYSLRELEAAETHDPYWNACQQEMVQRGLMHGYMRMYWGKKILEWTQNPEDAFAAAVELNDRYEMDGRDSNGYAGVAWVFGKHDRPWTERPIFGTIRYMNANGLRRKFKSIDEYVTRWTQ